MKKKTQRAPRARAKTSKVTTIKYLRFRASDGTEFDSKDAAGHHSDSIAAVDHLNATLDTTHTLASLTGIGGTAVVALPENAQSPGQFGGPSMAPTPAAPAAKARKVSAGKSGKKAAPETGEPMSLEEAKRFLRKHKKPGRPSAAVIAARKIVDAAGGGNAPAAKPRAARAKKGVRSKKAEGADPTTVKTTAEVAPPANTASAETANVPPPTGTSPGGYPLPPPPPIGGGSVGAPPPPPPPPPVTKPTVA